VGPVAARAQPVAAPVSFQRGHCSIDRAPVAGVHRAAAAAGVRAVAATPAVAGLGTGAARPALDALELGHAQPAAGKGQHHTAPAA